MLTAEITLSGVDVDVLCEAIGPELETGFTRARVDLKRLDDRVALMFKADDVNALRAAINSYLRWLRIIEDLKDEVSGSVD